jgi:hypothetical protein
MAGRRRVARQRDYQPQAAGRRRVYSGEVRPRLIAPAALALLIAIGASSSATAKAPYTATHGPSRADARFVVGYSGSGTYSTRFHATPPNPGGKPDTNDARDSSKQSWAVKFRRAVVIPTCAAPGTFGDDPCADLKGTAGASGPTEVIGKVNHKHVDGLYRELDRTVKCTLRKRPSPKRKLEVALDLRYIPESKSIGVSVGDPLFTTFSFFPGACPKQGDSIDRILDFYAIPGFSFAEGYGPDRWFESREVVIPEAEFHRSTKIRIPLHATAAGTPRKHCAVPNPSYERCKTGGSWNGVLTFKAKN